MCFIQSNDQIKTFFSLKNHPCLSTCKSRLNHRIQVLNIYSVLSQFMTVVLYGHLGKSGCCFYPHISNAFGSGNYFGYFFRFNRQHVDVLSIQLDSNIFPYTFEQFIEPHFNRLSKFIVNPWDFFQFFFHHLNKLLF